MNQMRQRPAPTGRWSPQLLNDIANAPNLAGAAELLGSSAIPVFPCVPGGKRPLTPLGFQDASADLDVINSWWRHQPEANIGVPTGTAGGIDVVDVDVHDTGSGYAAFEHARRAGFVEGWAWMVRTPSGGLHAYFLRTDQRQQRSWQVPGKHIDFRGDGGYIIVPPSRVTGDDGVSHSYQQIAVAEDRRPGPVEQVMPPEAISMLPFGTALVLLRSAPPLVTNLLPWTARRNADELRAGCSEVEQALRRGRAPSPWRPLSACSRHEEIAQQQNGRDR